MADPNDPWADDARPDEYDDAPAGHDPHAGDGPHADLGTYASDREVEAENPKKAVGTGVKVVVGLLVAGLGLAVVCCGVGAWAFVNGTDADRTPAGVRQRTDELLTIDIPDRFEPDQATRVDVPILNWVVDRPVTAVEYGTDGGGLLYIARNENVGTSRQAADAAQQAAELQLQFSRAEAIGRRVTETRTRTLRTADGREVDWRFATTEPGEAAAGGGEPGDGAADPADGPFRRVYGAIPDGGDVYVLQMAVPEADYDEAEVVAMLQSIRLIDPATEPVPAGNETPLNETPLEDPAPAGDPVPAGETGGDDAGPVIEGDAGDGPDADGPDADDLDVDDTVAPELD